MIINTQELVEKWGSEANKKYYKEKLKLVSSCKKSILSKASKYCEIVELGNGNYEVVKYYSEIYPKALVDITNSSIMKFYAPIVINQLIQSYNSNETLKLSLVNFYDYMNLIHKENYNTIRYNDKVASEELNLDIKTIYEFYDITNKSLKYYLENCLNLLEKLELIKWQKIKYLKERIIDVDNKHNSVLLNVKNIHRRATEDETQFYYSLLGQLKIKHEIKEDRECFYGEKSKAFKKEYEDTLIKKNIVYFYSGYEVFYTDIDRCRKFIEDNFNFEFTDYINKFTEEFIKINMENANNRHESAVENESKNFYRYNKKYMEDYKFLTKHTLDSNCAIEIDLGIQVRTEIDGDYHKYNNIITESS